MPSSWLHCQIAFFGLRPTESLIASTCSATFTPKWCPVWTPSPLELRSLYLEHTDPSVILAFVQVMVKMELSSKFCLHRFVKWLSHNIGLDTKRFLLSCPRHSSETTMLNLLISSSSRIWKSFVIYGFISYVMGCIQFRSPCYVEYLKVNSCHILSMKILLGTATSIFFSFSILA